MRLTSRKLVNKILITPTVHRLKNTAYRLSLH